MNSRHWSQIPKEEREQILNNTIVSTGREVSWDPKTRSFHCYSESWAGAFPRILKIESHLTGRVMEFVQDLEKAQANEFWDGEECHYVNRDINCTAVISHAY